MKEARKDKQDMNINATAKRKRAAGTTEAVDKRRELGCSSVKRENTTSKHHENVMDRDVN